MRETSNDDDLKPRYVLAKAKAKEVWGKICDEAIPIKLDVIAKALNIPVKAGNFNSAHGSTRMDSNGIIAMMYSKNCSIQRQRFTVAHEFGHVMLEHITFGEDSSQISSKAWEIEAESFAGELLIPSTDLKKFLKNKDKTMQDIIDRYWVSKEAAFVAVKNNRQINKIKVD